MSTDILINNRVSIWQRVGLLGLIALFVSMGISRLNDCDLFNPDSPRYVIYSKAIVDLGSYRATDLPGSPLYSWRPPGLPMLLAPVMAIWPYDVIAAKIVIIATGALLLWMVFHLTSLHCGGWMALLATAVVASNPSFYVMSTEVLTEIPYTLGVLVVLVILSQSSAFPSQQDQNDVRRWQYVLIAIAIAALSFTPWLRTAGISLVVAVGLWTLSSRTRFRWIPAVTIAVTAFGVLAWRNKQAGGENYVGSLLTRLRSQGLGPVIASGIETICHYVFALPGLLLPGVSLDRAWYSPLTMDGSPTLGLPFLFVACAAATLVTFGMIGMCHRRAHGGSLAFLYLLIYCACLVVWPWRHERFLWPLIPVLMSYVPVGASAVGTLVPFIQSSLKFLVTTVLVLLVYWQSLGCQQIANINREFRQDRERFHATRMPGFYFSNWRRAGEWLNANTPPSSRVLTWHAAVGGSSLRFQKRVQFETLTPDKLRQQIESFSARYLVVPDAQFGDGFGWQQIAADPAIRFNVVYREQDVVVLEIEPNRKGEVFKDEYPKWVDERLSLVATAYERDRSRTDLAIRYASLLREAGRADDAIGVLRGLLDRGIKTVRVCSELGWLLYENDDYANAATFLDMARTLPNAEPIANALADGVTRARERMKEHTNNPKNPPLARQIGRVKALIGLLKYAMAERELDKILAANSENAEATFLRGRLHDRVGEKLQAESCFERAMTLGLADAQQWLFELRCIRAIEGSTPTKVVAGDQKEIIDPTIPADYVRVVRFLTDRGWSGRALALLEQANERFPGEPTIQLPLADSYRQFASPELAIPIYESMLKSNPANEFARKGLEVAQFGLIKPAMFLRKRNAFDELFVRGRSPDVDSRN